MEDLNNVVDFPEMTDEEKNSEYARAQAATAYCELNVVYRAEQSLKRIVAKFADNPAFWDYARQMRILHHLMQYK